MVQLLPLLLTLLPLLPFDMGYDPTRPAAAMAVPLLAVAGGQDRFDKLLVLLCLSGERYARSSLESIL